MIVKTLLATLPEFPAFDVQDQKSNCSLLWVCVEEARHVQRLNVLLRTSLDQVEKIVAGALSPTPELHDICIALEHHDVPLPWQEHVWKEQKTLNKGNLSQWFQNVVEITRVWSKWITTAALALPPVLDLSNVRNPRAFVLALKHTKALELGTPGEFAHLALETHVLTFCNLATLPSSMRCQDPNECLLLSGLSLRGARWKNGKAKKNPKTIEDVMNELSLNSNASYINKAMRFRKAGQSRYKRFKGKLKAKTSKIMKPIRRKIIRKALDQVYNRRTNSRV